MTNEELQTIRTLPVPPAYSVSDIEKMRFNTLPFEGDWLATIGEPEVSGSWLVWGLSGNGKTRFALCLAKYLATFQRVYYNTKEEGLKKSFHLALKSVGMKAVGERFCFHSESYEQMVARLLKKRSPNIIIIDSVQFLSITKEQYEDLLALFPKKLFIFISHAKGHEPKGEVAEAIRYNSDVKIEVFKFLATPRENTRFGGSKPFVIWEEGYRRARLELVNKGVELPQQWNQSDPTLEKRITDIQTEDTD
jgi:hypothetical protein